MCLMRAEAQVRDSRDVALFERLRSLDMNRRIAGVDRKVVRDSNCDVVNLPLARCLFIDTRCFKDGASIEIGGRLVNFA